MKHTHTRARVVNFEMKCLSGIYLCFFVLENIRLATTFHVPSKICAKENVNVKIYGHYVWLIFVCFDPKYKKKPSTENVWDATMLEFQVLKNQQSTKCKSESECWFCFFPFKIYAFCVMSLGSCFFILFLPFRRFNHIKKTSGEILSMGNLPSPQLQIKPTIELDIVLRHFYGIFFFGTIKLSNILIFFSLSQIIVLFRAPNF